MGSIREVAVAALRLVAAFAVGLVCLVVLRIALSLIGPTRFDGFIILAGFVLVLIAAGRYAGQGNVTMTDRVAGTVAAASSVVAFGGVIMVALFGLAVAVILLALFGFAQMSVGGTAPVSSWFMQSLAAASIVVNLALLCAGGCFYAIWRMWSRRQKAAPPVT